MIHPAPVHNVPVFGCPKCIAARDGKTPGPSREAQYVIDLIEESATWYYDPWHSTEGELAFTSPIHGDQILFIEYSFEQKDEVEDEDE